jgi:hypothetical protein
MFESAIAAESVVDVHHYIVRPELLKIEQSALAIAARRTSPRARLAEEVLLAVDVKPVFLKDGTGRDFPLHDDRAEVRPFEQRCKALALGVDFDVVRFEVAPETRGLVGTFDHHQGATLAAADFCEFSREGLE